MILQLVEPDDPILLKQTTPFDFQNPPTDPIQLAYDLYETMVSHKGLGLAAPQVGLPYRAFALYAVPGIVCFNPRVIDSTSEEIPLEEGCLTYPNLVLSIKRPRKIKVRYFEPNSNVVTRVLDGMTARCFLHELDHLNGILYTRRASRIHLERALRKKKQFDRQLKREIKDQI
jgi:peptide deformylase